MYRQGRGKIITKEEYLQWKSENEGFVRVNIAMSIVLVTTRYILVTPKYASVSEVHN